MHDDLLTALNPERMNEAPITYKYPEHENEVRRKKTEDVSKEEDEVDIDEETFLNDEEEKKEVIATKVEEDDDNKKNIILIVVLSSILGLLVIALIVVFFVLPDATNSETVVVPDCENLKVSACEKKLHKLGFEVETDIEIISSATIEKNKVVKTNPEAGRNVKTGTKITIYKSGGEEVFEIEDYTGKNYIEVQTILETKFGLEVTIEKKEPEDAAEKEYDEQEIIGQSLAPGSEVKKGDAITLYIPDIEEEYPDMAALGWSREDAQAFCDKYEITLKVVEQETTQHAEGKVIGQSRAAGSPIAKKSTLTITVAKKPAEKPAEPEKSETTDNNGDEGSETTE